jgi:hypothetical protein
MSSLEKITANYVFNEHTQSQSYDHKRTDDKNCAFIFQLHTSVNSYETAGQVCEVIQYGYHINFYKVQYLLANNLHTE